MADMEVTTNAFTPMAFVREMVRAVVPLIDKDKLREGKTRADVFEGLRPLCGHYAVGDAFLAWQMLRAAQNACSYLGDPETDALHEATWMIETFVARGWPSSAECVSARAAALELKEDDTPSIGDANDAAARSALAEDVMQVRSGRYWCGAFDGGRERGPLPLWVGRAMEVGAQ